MSELMESSRLWPKRHVVADDGSVYPFPPADHKEAQGKRKRSGLGWSRRKAKKIGERDGWECHYCDHRLSRNDDRFRSPTIDHVIPRSRGGSNSMPNLVLSCPKCNREKDDQTPVEWLGEACCDRHADVSATKAEAPSRKPAKAKRENHYWNAEKYDPWGNPRTDPSPYPDQ